MKKFDNSHLGKMCNVPYIYSLTILGFNEERKLVRVGYNFGQYERVEAWIPVEDINLED